MLTATSLFLFTTLFALLLLIVIKEPLSLALFFSSGNALIASAAGMDILKCAAVFIASFGIFLITIAVTNLILKIREKKKNVKSAQK